jgi:two-component system, OmpR family, response regulator
MATPTILLIDNDPGFSYLLQRYIASFGGHYLHAANVELALELAQGRQPALIILHRLQPPHNGLDALQALKIDRLTQHIPIAVCSGQHEQAQAWEDGADFWLPKPVMYTDFLAVLATLGLAPGTEQMSVQGGTP